MSAFRQGMVDNNLLSKRYLPDVPTDPTTGSRYVYGVSNDGQYFQVAGNVQDDNGNWTALLEGNLAKESIRQASHNVKENDSNYKIISIAFIWACEHTSNV